MIIEPNTSLVCASLLTGVYDVNRNENLESNNFETIKAWYNSILKLDLNAIIFHNNFSEKTVELYETNKIKFLQVKYDTSYNPNIYRYFLYKFFLEKHKKNIANVFVTDITDVEVINNPFKQKLFVENTEALFCGDEPKRLNNSWMYDHSTHLRNNISNFISYEEKFADETLLNCGIIGGNINTMISIMNFLVEIHLKYGSSNKTAFTLDMGVFNYIARTIFGSNLIFGNPVNTIFKKYEKDSFNCWFRHK